MRPVALIALALIAPTMRAQSTSTGRVLTDSGVPIVGAELVIARLQGRGSEMFVTNTRQRAAGEPGPRSMCRALVWLDGVNLGTEFNVNSLDPSTIAAVEWYAGQFVPAKLAVPPRFSATTGGIEQYCGVLVIWLR